MAAADEACFNTPLPFSNRAGDKNQGILLIFWWVRFHGISQKSGEKITEWTQINTIAWTDGVHNPKPTSLNWLE